ncbi:hypothetical protein [Dermacoccus sp. Ellin185]|uniref:hypothetical protein n=1 Tax=Dermacoccus sp. Ellin185 TaxID=188626 RepID=UPI0011126467|nr:hypothetical protein [Dermacoccus sp. Ellin185]
MTDSELREAWREHKDGFFKYARGVKDNADVVDADILKTETVARELNRLDTDKVVEWLKADPDNTMQVLEVSPRLWPDLR